MSDSCDIMECQNIKGAEGGPSNYIDKNRVRVGQHGSHTGKLGRWRPLLLIVPLRLGLTDINSVYIDSLMVSYSNPHD